MRATYPAHLILLDLIWFDLTYNAINSKPI
jgi:hypothetical protein